LPTFRTFLASAGAIGDNSSGVPTALFIWLVIGDCSKDDGDDDGDDEEAQPLAKTSNMDAATAIPKR